MAESWLQCFSGCEDRYSPYDVVYRCPHCQSLLEVQHDLEALAEIPAEAWMARFDERLRGSPWPDGVSGVWGKKEWVLPQLPDDAIVSLYEGGTPLLALPDDARSLGIRKLWMKQCGHAHTGSFKDLGMTVLVSAVQAMRARGQEISAVACASTGDTSAALAAYCARAGIPAVVLLPAGKISTAQLVQPMAHGALVLALETDFDGCMALVQELTKEPTIYLANSMNSLRVEGQKTVAIEVVQQLRWRTPDWFVIPGGNLGNVSALAKGLTMMKTLGLIDRLPRIAVAQVAVADPLYRSYRKGWSALEPISAGPTSASAIRIGNPVSFPKAISALKATDGVVCSIDEGSLADAAGRADRHGLFACPHTAVALAATAQLREQGEIRADDEVVIVSTANGLKFADFKVRYHEGALAASHDANKPIACDATVEAVREAVQRRP